MTVLVPIEVDQPPAAGQPQPTTLSGRSFASSPEPGDEAPDLADVVRRVRSARRIVVVCGAGVSTAAAIPDFRSAQGLFSGSKGHAVKDLFHVKSLSSHTLLPEHHALLTDLCERTSSAEPTAFHKLLAAIENDGRLLRCYTQNIDGLEERAGLRTGIPPHRKRARRTKAAAGAGAEDASANASTAASVAASASESAVNTPTDSGTPLGDATVPMPTVAPVEHPPAPRCIPLHGLLRDMHCSLCSSTVPIADFLPLPAEPIPCPQCHQESTIRSALSERQRRVGTLRASVVLYGEEHPEGELIGSVVERDLKGTGRRGEREGRADLLIVAGTSLAIPGVKRIVKEMAKVLSARSSMSVRDGKAPPIRTVFLNAEPPAKLAEWDGVFDVWARGDIQKFAELIGDETFAPPEPKKEATPRSTPKKKAAAGMPPTPDTTPSKQPPSRTRKLSSLESSDEDNTPTKKKPRTTLPLTPRPTPPRPKEKEKPTTKRTARRPRASSPSPAAKEEAKPSAPKKQRPRPKKDRTSVKKEQHDDNPYLVTSEQDDEREVERDIDIKREERNHHLHGDRAFVDVPPLPGHHAEWGTCSPPPYSHRPLTLTYTAVHTYVPPLPLPTFKGAFGDAIDILHPTPIPAYPSDSQYGEPPRARARFSPPPPIGI